MLWNLQRRSATNEAATFTTDKEGNSNTVELEEGTYYVKEKKAAERIPAG